MLEWYINGKEMTQNGAYISTGYIVTSAPVNRSVYAGGCSAYVATKAKIGLKSLKIPVRIVKSSAVDASRTKSAILSMCLGDKVDIMLSNGDRYVAALVSAGEAESVSNGVLDFTLEFLGYQRGELVSAKTPAVMCFSTAPETLYKATVKSDRDGSFVLAGITFLGCKPGDKLVVDGLTGRLLKNGTPVLIADTDFVSFPFLQPGENEVRCTTEADIEYYPVFL